MNWDGPRTHASRSRTRMAAARALVRLGIAAGLCGACVWGVLGGCSKPLLSPAEDRSPYDRYDALRNQRAAQVIEDEYGRRQPNLRSRLGSK